MHCGPLRFPVSSILGSAVHLREPDHAPAVSTLERIFDLLQVILTYTHCLLNVNSTYAQTSGHFATLVDHAPNASAGARTSKHALRASGLQGSRCKFSKSTLESLTADPWANMKVRAKHADALRSGPQGTIDLLYGATCGTSTGGMAAPTGTWLDKCKAPTPRQNAPTVPGRQRAAGLRRVCSHESLGPSGDVQSTPRRVKSDEGE
ncbi:uncharacterized protein BXZ73DRAFT_77977 [Epithele typhae]|uniref:uncharacterized protein n=1 Tax=Epithele typhae TaxID=378194 RepID=UPI002007D777|nr:uncharacterized protein BXZ73DRAFT_77977 [Epithele typhae]KAH9929854.1 hypothetical protein BXZ73DRAFT_77977 [Epithele typhae]